MNIEIDIKLIFFPQIRENHRQKEKAMNDFTDFVARTSNFQLLKVRIIHCHILKEKTPHLISK